MSTRFWTAVGILAFLVIGLAVAGLCAWLSDLLHDTDHDHRGA